MDKKLLKIKQSVLKIVLISTVFFLISAVVFFLLIIGAITSSRFKITIEVALGIFSFITAVVFLFALVGGSVFLAKNKKTTDLKKIKSRWALDVGILYFKVSERISKAIDELIESEKDLVEIEE